MIAGWLERRQQEVVEYVRREEAVQYVRDARLELRDKLAETP